MPKSISVHKTPKRGPGRPATGLDPAISARLPHATMTALLQWAKDQDISKSEAIRRLVEQALGTKPKR
jgi:hypothetical protein